MEEKKQVTICYKIGKTFSYYVLKVVTLGNWLKLYFSNDKHIFINKAWIKSFNTKEEEEH